MSQPKEQEHTSKSVTESQFLPPLQKRILLCLAESHPRSRYDTVKAIKGHYKSVWTAFDSLEEKGIILKVNFDEYRGRTHPMFWLTTAGVFIALIEGTSPKTLLKKTLEIYPENKLLQCIVEVSTILGTDMYKIGYLAVLSKGKLEKDDASAMLGAQIQKELSLEQIKDLISIMKKYPEQFGDFKEQTDHALENLKKVELFLKDAYEEK